MKKPLLILLALLAVIPVKAQRNTGFYEDYVQLVPYAMYLGLGAVGAQHNSSYGDMLIAGSVSALSMAAIVNSMKYTVCEMRPNGTARNSFPSGHTATAFTGAELVRMEYGWGWGTGAYALASFVACSRVVHQCHWWWDTAAGAAIGVASAHIGTWSTVPVRKLFGWKLPENSGISFVPATDPCTGSFYATVAFNF